MVIDPGDSQATSGMAKLIYDAMKAQLEPALKGSVKDEDLAKIEDGWKSLSVAIASGVAAELTRDTQDPFFAWLAGFATAAQNGTVATFLTASPVPTNLRGIR